MTMNVVEMFGPRLWNDLYCVEWDVKPSILYHWKFFARSAV